jgi:tetratricopeptide (TPR) repeat protein
VDAEPHLWGATSEPWLDRLEMEYQNIRAGFHAFAARERLAEAWEMIPPMARYWSVRGGFSEGADWVVMAGFEGVDRRGDGPFGAMSRERAGKALTWAGFVRMQLMQLNQGFALLEHAESLLRDSRDEVSLAFAVGLHGSYGSFFGRDDAAARTLEAERLVRRTGDTMALLFYLTWSCEHYRKRGELDIALRNLDEATRLATEGDHLHILGNLYLIRFGYSLLEPSVDLDRMASEAEAVLRRFPEKGYKGLKGAAWHGFALSRLLRGELDAAWPFLRRGLENAREAGEPEGQFYGAMAAMHYFGRRGRRDFALKILGAVDQFIAGMGFPLVSMLRRQYDLARDAAVPTGCEPELEPAYREGRKSRIDEAVVLALKGES